MELGDGKYRAKAKAWDLGESGNGSEQVAVEFELLDAGVAGQSITWHGYFTEKSLPITIKALRTCGWEGDDILELNGLDKNEVSLTVENEEYEGKVYPKVRWVNPPGGLAMKTPMSQEKRRSFAAQMRGKIAAIDAAEGRAKQTLKAKPRPAGGDRRPEPPPITDDIPF